MQLEKVTNGAPPYMRFRPDNGNYFSTWSSGVRREPEIDRVKGDSVNVPINPEDVEALTEALNEQRKGEMLRIIRKYVQTTGLGIRSVPRHPLEGSVHTVTGGADLFRSHARVAHVSSEFYELAHPGAIRH